jgi:hypothetical protein
MLIKLSAKTLQLIILLAVSIGLADMANAQRGVQITLGGSLDEIAATNVAGADDTAAFESILPFSHGAPVTATVRYLFGVEDRDDRETVGRFLTGSMEINVAGTVFEPIAILIDILNEDSSPGFPLFDQFRAFGAAPWNAAGWDFEFVRSSGVFNGVELTDLSGSVFDSDDLPVEPFAIDDFGAVSFTISDDVGEGNIDSGPNTVVSPLGSHVGDSHRISGSFSSLTFQTIPEPASEFLLTLAALGLPLKRRRSA